MMGAIELLIDRLLLDSENPRISGASSQRDTLQRLLDDQEEKLFALAESITSDGMSPIDRLLVVRENNGSDRFIALEGNRRVAALKILSNPSVLTGLQLKASLQKRFEELAKNFDRSAVEPIACFEVPSREEGTSWLFLRHTGENEGKGVVAWSGLAASRFRGTDPALQALEFVGAHGNLSDDQKDSLVDSFPITTLDRLLSSREVRKRIGVEVRNRKLSSGLPAEELMKALRRMVLDLAEKNVNVSQLKNSTQQIAYIEGLDSASRPDLSKVGVIRAVENIQSDEFKAKPKRVQRGTPRDPAERRTVIPRGWKISVSDSKVASIFKELRGLRVDEYPNAIAVLLRVFLELSVDCYMDSNSLVLKYKDPKSNKVVEKSLKKKIAEVVEHLIKAKGFDRKDFAGVTRGLSVEHSPLYVDLLHAYLHNRFVTPKTRDLIGALDDARRFFEGIWA
jgi:hypothetical protein